MINDLDNRRVVYDILCKAAISVLTYDPEPGTVVSKYAIAEKYLARSLNEIKTCEL